MIRKTQTLAAFATALGLAGLLHSADTATPASRLRACDRELRRTFEALQAWRRTHDGAYPGRLIELELKGLTPRNDCTCPSQRLEQSDAIEKHAIHSSRTRNGDPVGKYEYELTTADVPSESSRRFLPEGARPYTRQDVKLELLRRPFNEQIPILRCMVHATTTGPDSEFAPEWARNFTHDGRVYWSGQYWERVWLDHVPAPARSAMVLFGLEGPPFHSGVAPALPHALDLRPWSTGFPQRPWSTLTPLIEIHGRMAPAPDLAPFTGPSHPAVREAAGESWWIDGLVQLQGRRDQGLRSPDHQPHAFDYAWEKTGLPVGRRFSRATWLQGTLAPDLPGTPVGWLTWQFEDGSSAEVPIRYGEDTAVFWLEPGLDSPEPAMPSPAWHHEIRSADAPARHVRLYRQEWLNPHPGKTVRSVGFKSSRHSKAGPFLLAVNLHP